MADNSKDIKPYPLMFDPSQWANKYSDYAGRSLNPYMGQYNGGATGPTDAHGNPIASYQAAQTAHDAWNAANPAPPPSQAPAVTLNSNPYGSMFGGLAPNSPGGPDTQAQYAYNLGLGGVNPGSAQGRAIAAGQQTAAQPYIPTNIGAGGGAGAAGQAQQPQQPRTNPIDMNQAYMAALSNPGHVTTPGATVPQSAPPSSQSGVLQQFLQNWQGGGGQTKGAGNYDNSGFFNALKGMV